MREQGLSAGIAGLLLCAALLFSGCEDSDDSPELALDFGISDPYRAAVVVSDETPACSIVSLGLALSDGSSDPLELGSVPNDTQVVFPVPPGEFFLPALVHVGPNQPPAGGVLSILPAAPDLAPIVSPVFDIGPGEAVVFVLKGNASNPVFVRR